MFAGHGKHIFYSSHVLLLIPGLETTAHVLTATLALLAFHQEEQDKVLREIRSVVPDNKDPVSI